MKKPDIVVITRGVVGAFAGLRDHVGERVGEKRPAEEIRDTAR
jgi:hypothetical protein